MIQAYFMHKLSFVYALSLSNKTGRKQSKLRKAQNVELYYKTIVIRVGGVCQYFKGGVLLSIPKCRFISNRSMMNVQS